MDFASNSLLDTPRDEPGLLKYLGFSAIGHLLALILFLVFSGSLNARPPAAADFIAVDLVSLPETTAGPSTAKTPTAPASPGKTKAAVYKKPDKLPKPVRATPETKTALKTKTFDPKKMLTETIAQLKKNVEKDAPDSVAQALERLRQQVTDRDKSVQISDKQDKTAGATEKKAVAAMDIYKLEIRYRILENWVFPRQAAGGNTDLKTVIAIKIDAHGKILDMWFDRRSGNDYYDESARKAILKSAPLPELPPGYLEYTVGLEFTPSALE